MKKEYMNPKAIISLFDAENIVTESSTHPGIDGQTAAARAMGNINTDTMQLTDDVRFVY